MQLANKAEDRDQVVILFQDMLEVVTRDIMEDQISRSGPKYFLEGSLFPSKMHMLMVLRSVQFTRLNPGGERGDGPN